MIRDLYSAIAATITALIGAGALAVLSTLAVIACLVVAYVAASLLQSVALMVGGAP